MRVRSVYEAKDTLGEGPVWSDQEQAIFWVDIMRAKLQRWHPESGDYQSWTLPSHIGSFALRQQGGALVALQTGFALLDFATGEVTPLCDPEAGIEDTRFNDGKCDRQGRFWAGTQEYALEQARGALYRLDPDGSCHKMRDQVICSNGIGWSPDNRTMYYTDSFKYEIYAYDFDPDTGTITNERVFAKDQGYVPDGLTVDSEGFVWSAKWDGWKVVRYAADGKIDREIEMPVQRPTSCVFGGSDLTQLYVTSASIDLAEEERAKGPLAGNLFVIETGIQGIAEPRFAG